MSDRDNITLPREVVQEAADALADFVYHGESEGWWRVVYALRTHLAAPKQEHPGYVIGSHWLETAYSRICAGEAEADVLRDCGWERVDEALRRDAERLREELRQSSIDHTRAEVERLREALQGIAEVDLTGCDLPVAGHIAHGLIGRARAALRREEA